MRIIGLSFCLIWLSQATADVIDGEQLVDPTRPLRVPEPGTDIVDIIGDFVSRSGFEVTFVRVSNTAPMAVVNNQQVTIGDIVGGAEVLTIDRGGVTLLVDSEERRISVYANSIISPAGEL